VVLNKIKGHIIYRQSYTPSTAILPYQPRNHTLNLLVVFSPPSSPLKKQWLEKFSATLPINRNPALSTVQPHLEPLFVRLQPL